MGFSQYPTITDEMLSAYIDNAVSDADRATVETAIANDVEIAWRVESLRSTVSLLGQLTDVPLPRSFTLNDALLEIAPSGESLQTPSKIHQTDSPTSLWERWLDFWHSGSMAWRNAAAVCALLLLVFLVGDLALLNGPSTTSNETATLNLEKPRDITADTSAVAMNEIEATSVESVAVATAAAVAMVSEPAKETEEQIAPEPMAAMEQTVEENAEVGAMQPSAVAMDVEEETVPLEEGPSDDALSNDGTFEFAQADKATKEEFSEAESLPIEPIALSSASVRAGNVMTGTTLRMSPALESSNGVDEPAAGLVVAASALDDNDTLEETESTSPAEATETLAAEVTGADSTIAEPVADAASPEVEAEALPQAMMLTDDANEEAADTDGQEPAIAEAGSAVVASVNVEPPQSEATATLVSEPAVEESVVAELAVQEAPLAEPQAEATQMPAVAMADSADLSVAAESGQLPSQRAEPLSEPLVEESEPNSARLWGFAQLLLAILALIFFVLWLRSRSQSAAVPSQD